MGFLAGAAMFVAASVFPGVGNDWQGQTNTPYNAATEWARAPSDVFGRQVPGAASLSRIWCSLFGGCGGSRSGGGAC